MRRSLVFCLAMIALAGCRSSSETATANVCAESGDGQLRCAIAKLADCEAVRDYPYARNLFCPASFSAAQTMVATLADSIGAKAPTTGFFYYYQTLADPDAEPDDQSQTTVPCLETRAPWGSRQVLGAGLPLCHLIAYVTSPGPMVTRSGGSGNPIPSALRPYPDFFRLLYQSDAPSLAREFHPGGGFDRWIRNLGSSARDRFVADYPAFSAEALYDPADWIRDPEYNGISGGGGSGWGGEIDIEHSPGKSDTLLAFGGGGGGGMTSTRRFGMTSSSVGAGGGGGLQLAGGYQHGGRRFDGLGLGAGVGSNETAVQYSYYDYEESGRPARSVHEKDPAVVADYQRQLTEVVAQLKAGFAAGKTMVLRGGGGMGGGAEYLMPNGEEYAPHALSTQAGFQFRYEFQNASAASSAPAQRTVSAGENDEGAYEILGELYRRATQQAFQECGSDYANYACMCRKTHAIVVGRMASELGDASNLPVWLREQHCPADVPRDSFSREDS